MTAVYNRADSIEDAMRSLQLQSYPDVEHVIQDGGSTDGTLNVIERCRLPNTMVMSAPDSGIYEALNRGISRATGELIGVLHSDDVFAGSEVLSKVATAFEDPSVVGVYGDLEYVVAGDPQRVIRYWKSSIYRPAMLRQGWMPPHPTLFLRRLVFEKLGCYDASFRISADYEAILRWFKQAKSNFTFTYLDEVLVRMRLGGESNRSVRNLLHKSREDLCAIRRHQVGGITVLIAKNFRKLPQFFARSIDDVPNS